GLLMIAMRKIEPIAKPVLRSEKPCACCKNKEPSVPMLVPVKSRRLKQRLITMKNAQSTGVGNRLEGATARSCSGDESSSAHNQKTIAPITPTHPSSTVGVRQPACCARHPLYS